MAKLYPSATPPSAPNTQVAGPESPRGSGEGTPNESLRYLLGCWAFMISGELLYQVLATVALFIDPSRLREAAVAAAERSSQDVSAAMVTLSMYFSIVLMTLFQLLIVALLAVGLRAIAGRKKWAAAAWRMLTIFSAFFAIRTLFVFLAPATPSDAPLALIAVLGIIQISVGVAGVCALIYASHKEARDSIPDPDKKDR